MLTIAEQIAAAERRNHRRVRCNDGSYNNRDLSAKVRSGPDYVPFWLNYNVGTYWRKCAATVSCESGSAIDGVNDSTVIDTVLDMLKGMFWVGYYYTDHEYHKRLGICGYAKESATPHNGSGRLHDRSSCMGQGVSDMKTADVKIGEVYLTKVGADSVRVIPTVKTGGDRFGSREKFICKREDNGNVLPKARTAAALHEAPKPKKLWKVCAHDRNGDVLVSGRTDNDASFVARIACHNKTVQARFGLVGGLSYKPRETEMGHFDIMLDDEVKGAICVYEAEES